MKRFIPGHATFLCTGSMSAILTVFMSVYLRHENGRRNRWATENNMLPENYSEDQKVAERDKGDNATFYQYTP